MQSEVWRRLRSLLANLLLLGGSLLCCAALTLAVLLNLPAPAPADAGPQLPDYGELVAYDPARPGGHLKPGLDLWVQGERAGQRVRWRTDRHGFRIDHDLVLPKPAGIERVILLGDSYIDGMRTDQSQTIGALLEAKWRAGGAAVEVLISGHNNPANAWYWLQEHSAAFQPDRVLLAITLGNDLMAQNLGAGLAVGADGRVQLVNPQLVDGKPDRWPSLLPPDAYTAPNAWLDAWNQREFAWRERLAARYGWFAHSVPSMTGPFPNALRQVYDRDLYVSTGLYFVPANAFAEESFAASATTLKGIAGLLRERGVAFEVMLLPIRIQVSKPDWRLFKRRYGLEGQRFDLRAPNRRLLAACAEAGIVCLDPTEAMAEAIAERGLQPFRPRGDMHYNEAGNAFIAEFWAGQHKP